MASLPGLLLVLLGALPCVAPSQGLAGGLESSRNARFGYSLAHPPHWKSSGIRYANAFELRNYDPKAPESVPESDRASVIAVDILHDDETAAKRFLDETLRGTPDDQRRERRIDGRRAVEIQTQVPEQQLGPGTRRALGLEPSQAPPRLYHSVVTYVLDGRLVISIEGRAPAEATRAVVREIVEIERSLRFDAPRP